MSTPTPTPGRGRRVAERKPGAVSRQTVAGGVLVALAAGMLAVAGLAGSADGPDAVSTSVPVDHVTAVCASGRPELTGSRTMLLGSAPLDGLGSGGRAVFAPDGNLDGAEPQRLERGRAVELRPESTGVVDVDGGLAAGTFVFQADRDSDAPSLATAECPTPRARWYFTGAGATVDHQSTLVLTNVDPGPAVVDVTVLGTEGEVDTVGTRGLTVPAGETLRIPMVDVAPQGEALSIQVSASRGRVAAAVADRFAAEPGDAPGTDWLPAQTAASRSLRVAPVIERADSSTLVVANHGRLEALVEVEVSGPSGAFQPTENAELQIPPGSVVTADLGSGIGKDAASVNLRSSSPVSATVRSLRGGDTSYAGEAPPLTGPAVAPVLGDKATVQLSAGRRDATAQVTAYDADGKRVDQATVEVPATATSTWRPGRDADYVLVEPGSGALSGGISYSGSGGTSQVRLQPLPVELRKPAVLPVLAAR